MNKKRIIPYYRFSSSSQIGNSSIHRQKTSVEAYAKAHGYIIDSGSQYSDHGLSGYDGTNVVDGELGGLIDALQNNKLGDPKQLILAVDTIDRLTRQDQVKGMMTVMYPLLQTGIEIITINDNQHYTLDNISNEKAPALMLLLGISSANEYSKLISKNVRAAYNKKYIELEKSGINLKICLPSWLEYSDSSKSTIQFKYPQITSVQMIVKLGLSGGTCNSIVNELVDNNMPTLARAKTWNVQSVNRILGNASLHGQFKSTTRDIVFANYYPLVITKEQFNIIQAHRMNRTHNSKGRRTLSKGGICNNLFTGLLICEECGSGMALNKNGSNSIALRCNGKAIKNGCTMKQICYYRLEKLLLTFMKNIDINAIFNTNHDADELTKLYADLINMTQSITEIKLDLADGYNKDLSKMLRTYSEKRDVIQSEIDALTINNTVVPDFSTATNIDSLLLTNNGDNAKRVAYAAKLKMIVSKILIEPHTGFKGQSRSIRVYYSNGQMTMLNFYPKSANSTGSIGMFINNGKSIDLF